MAISRTLLEGGFDTVDAQSFTTGSFTPGSNRLVLITITARDVAGDPPIPTLTGNGLTWVNIQHQISAGPTGRSIDVFRAMGASPSTGTLVIDYGVGQTLRNCAWQIDEFDGVDTSGTNGSGAVVQSDKGNGGSAGTSITLTLVAFGDATNNASYIGVFHGSNEGTTPETGYTELGDHQTGENNTLGAAFKLGEDLSPSESWATSDSRAGIALEIKAAAAAAGFTHSQAVIVG